jgi:hypothetical protein
VTPAEVLVEARRLVVDGKRGRDSDLCFNIGDILAIAAAGDREVAWTAWQALDAATAKGLTFQMWCDGGEVHLDGDRFGVTYRYDRHPAEIAAALGKCALRLGREAA